MIRGDELVKIKVLIKAYLVTHPGGHTAGQISRWINTYNFGIVHGVTATEIGVIIKNHSHHGFMRDVQSRNRFKSGGKEYYITQK